MAIRSTLLPAAMLAIPFLGNACVADPTSVPTTARALGPSLQVIGPVSLKLDPTAGNFPPPDFAKETGNGQYSQARWTNKVALDGRFSVLLEKSVDFTPCATVADNGCAAFAAVIVNGVEGLTIAELGNIGFSVMGTCGGGSPRFNLFFDSNNDGQPDGVAFYGCGNHITSVSDGWTSMSVSAAAPESCSLFESPDPCGDLTSAIVIQLSVLVDEKGTWNIDRVQAAGATTGEPSGG